MASRGQVVASGVHQLAGLLDVQSPRSGSTLTTWPLLISGSLGIDLPISLDFT
jgi:hypothetical protein